MLGLDDRYQVPSALTARRTKLELCLGCQIAQDSISLQQTHFVPELSQELGLFAIG